MTRFTSPHSGHGIDPGPDALPGRHGASACARCTASRSVPHRSHPVQQFRPDPATPPGTGISLHRADLAHPATPACRANQPIVAQWSRRSCACRTRGPLMGRVVVAGLDSRSRARRPGQTRGCQPASGPGYGVAEHHFEAAMAGLCSRGGCAEKRRGRQPGKSHGVVVGEVLAVQRAARAQASVVVTVVLGVGATEVAAEAAGVVPRQACGVGASGAHPTGRGCQCRGRCSSALHQTSRAWCPILEGDACLSRHAGSVHDDLNFWDLVVWLVQQNHLSGVGLHRPRTCADPDRRGRTSERLVDCRLILRCCHHAGAGPRASSLSSAGDSPSAFGAVVLACGPHQAGA